MNGTTVSHKKLLENLRQALLDSPTDLEVAYRYWKALASSQSGFYVIEAFRSAALASPAGAVAFARAYRELFESSGESPRAAFFDEPLVRALENVLSAVPETDRDSLLWVLKAIR